MSLGEYRAVIRRRKRVAFAGVVAYAGKGAKKAGQAGLGGLG